MVAEVVGGLLTGSLALLADAALMVTDVGGLGLALLAIRFAAKEATPQRTYGYLRMEVLTALANAGVLLLLLSTFGTKLISVSGRRPKSSVGRC